jgi:hypothetical protein
MAKDEQKWPWKFWSFWKSNVGNAFKVHIFGEGHNILQNLHQFDWQYIGKIIVGDFAKFYGLLRIYEL